MINWSKPIRNIGPFAGKPARVICTNRKTGKCELTVIVLVDMGTHENTVYCRWDGLAPAFGRFENVEEAQP